MPAPVSLQEQHVRSLEESVLPINGGGVHFHGGPFGRVDRFTTRFTYEQCPVKDEVKKRGHDGNGKRDERKVKPRKQARTFFL